MSQPVSPANTPTPNNMPGAAPQTTPPTQTQTTTAPPEKAPDAPANPAPATTTDPQGTEAPPTQQPGESNVDWKERARLWEERAKVKGVTQEALDKAAKWDEYQESQKTEDQKRREADAAKDRRIAELEQKATRETVARETGVPPRFLVGDNEAEMREAAEEFKKVAGTPATQPTSSAVPASVVTSTDKVEGPKQITSRDELAKMSPAETMKAYREGRLTQLGAAPGQGDLAKLQHATKAAATQGK